MSLQFAFLLTFVAGALSAWICMTMSRKVRQERLEVIKKQIRSLGGSTISVDLADRKDCPFSDDFKDPDLVYKFYKINYDLAHELKRGWAILDMKQRWYGPGGAIQSHWTWRL
jgi:hypothetical protein